MPFVTRLFHTIETGAYRDAEDNKAPASAPSAAVMVDEERPSRNRRDRHQDETMGGSSRRRGRGGGSDDEDEHRRYNKRRRDDDSRRPGSPRGRDSGSGRQHPRDGSAPGGGGGRGSGNGARSGHRGGGGGDWGERFAGDPARRRNFPPEWGVHGPPPMGMWPMPHGYPPQPRAGGGFPPPPHHPMAPDFDPNAYNPENPGMHPHPPPPPMMMPRHMGGAPYYPYPGGRGRGRGFHGGRGGGPVGPKGDGSDEVSSSAAVAPTGARTTLRVSNVDPKYVNMTKLSVHFSKFGNVVNVQMRPNHRCAYVQYATEEEAKKAFHSPIPVCNNRFIEVKWARYDAKDPQGAPSEEPEGTKSTKDEPTEGAPATKPEGTVSADAAKGEKNLTPEELQAAALEKGRKVLEEKRELLEKQRQLMKQKEELLKRQLAQQKELLERMSQNSANVSVADKRELLNKITALSEELKALQPRRDSADQNKLSGLKAELSALEAQAANAAPSYGGRGGRGGPGGRGGWAGGAGGRGYYRGGGGGGRGGRGGRSPYAHYSNTLDNRTTIIKVENLPEEARDASVLEQHFGNFGAIERVIVDEHNPERGFIKFQDRYGGQTALTRGGVYGQTSLRLSWVEVDDAPSTLAPNHSVQSSEGAPTSSSTTDATQEVPASA